MQERKRAKRTPSEKLSAGSTNDHIHGWTTWGMEQQVICATTARGEGHELIKIGWSQEVGVVLLRAIKLPDAFNILEGFVRWSPNSRVKEGESRLSIICHTSWDWRRTEGQRGIAKGINHVM